MKRVIRCSAVAVLLVLSAACGDSGPTSPTSTRLPPAPSAPAPPPPTPPVPSFPPPSGPSRTFTSERPLASSGVQSYTTTSRFILYDNGAFVLKFESPAVEYRGGYTETNGDLTFDWEGWSAAGPWGATGTLADETLIVRYNFIMIMTDFEDAVYVLAR